MFRTQKKKTILIIMTSIMKSVIVTNIDRLKWIFLFKSKWKFMTISNVWSSLVIDQQLTNDKPDVCSFM